MRWLVAINPLYYVLRIIREVFLKGNGIVYFWQDLLALAAIAGVAVSASLAVFRRLVRR